MAEASVKSSPRLDPYAGQRTIVGAVFNPGKNQASRSSPPVTMKCKFSGCPGKFCKFISEWLREGETVRYTRNPEMDPVTSTAKKINAKIKMASLVYQIVGCRSSEIKSMRLNF